MTGVALLRIRQYLQTVAHGAAVPAFGKNAKKNAALAVEWIRAQGHKAELWTRPGTATAAIWSHGTVYVNTSHKHWRDPVASQSYQHSIGYLSSNHPLHTLHHEIGHDKFDPPDNFFGGPYGPQGKIATTVSKYAGRNPKEFVSEVYAGLQAGITFSPEVMNLYRMHARPREQ